MRAEPSSAVLNAVLHTMSREHQRSAAAAHLDQALSVARCALRLAACSPADARTEILSAALQELDRATEHLHVIRQKDG